METPRIRKSEKSILQAIVRHSAKIVTDKGKAYFKSRTGFPDDLNYDLVQEMIRRGHLTWESSEGPTGDVYRISLSTFIRARRLKDATI